MDETNPRSLAFQMRTLSDHADELPATGESPAPRRPHQLLKHAIRRLRAGNLRVPKPRSSKASPELDALLEGLLGDLRAASDALTTHYFTHAAEV